MDKEKDTLPDSLPEALPMKVNFRIPGRMPTVYAHHMMIQPGEFEVTLAFFEIMLPPIVRELTEEETKHLREQGLVAECVARVTVAAERFPNFARAMMQIAEAMRALEEAAEK